MNPIEHNWQISYEKYGGLKMYNTIKKLYWDISSYYIDTEGRYGVANFPIIGYDESITNLLRKFREDLIKPIKYYEED